MSTVYHDEQHESILWHPSEVLTDIDLNYAQRLRDRRILDGLFQDLLMSSDQLRPIRSALAVQAQAAPDMSVLVMAGSVLWRQTADPGSPDAQILLHRLPGDLAVAIDAADATNPRIDIISVKIAIDAEDVGGVGPDVESRVIKVDDVPTFSANALDKRRRTLLTVTYTPGVPAASPVAPSPPAGEVVIAEIAVAAAASSIANSDITDLRNAGQVIRKIPVISGYAANGATGTLGFSSGYPNGQLTFASSIAGVGWAWPVPLIAGERVLSARAHLKNIAGSWQLSIINGGNGTGTRLGYGITSGTAEQTVEAVPDAPYIADDVCGTDRQIMLFIWATSGSSACGVADLEVTTDIWGF